VGGVPDGSLGPGPNPGESINKNFHRDSNSPLGNQSFVHTDMVGYPVTCDEPNKFARPARLELKHHAVVVHGYQEFVLTRDAIRVLPEDPMLQRKQGLLAPFFQPRYLKQRTVLDLGAAAGFYCFWALQNGAESATALDIDENYIRMMEEVRTRLGFDALRVVKANVADWDEPGDVVLALTLVHWIYSCTAVLGSLDAVVSKLAQFAKYMLIVEWIDPGDPTVVSFGHIQWNAEFVKGPYTLEAFETALDRHFPRRLIVGEISPTRRLYVAFASEHEVDLSGPLPLLMPKETVISSCCLTRLNGIEYWSRVYDGGSVVHKQGTLDLAEREAYFLSRLSSGYFPRALGTCSANGFSVVVLEKIHGLPLRKAADSLVATPAALLNFCKECLNLLRELKCAGVKHRDIRPDNIFVRNGRPVLFDFGWAVSDEKPYVTPPLLGGAERPPDGVFCDVYSMGRVLEGLNQHRYPEVDLVLELMTEPDASLRIADLDVLQAILNVVTGGNQCSTWGDQAVNGQGIPRRVEEELKAYQVAIRQLLDQVSSRNKRLSFLASETDRLNRTVAGLETRVTELTAQLAERDRTVAGLETRVTELTAQLAERDRTVAGLQARLAKSESTCAAWESQAQRLYEQHEMVTAALHTIETSIAWKIILRYRTALNRLAPPDTQRRRVYRRVILGVANGYRMLKGRIRPSPVPAARPTSAPADIRCGEDLPSRAPRRGVDIIVPVYNGLQYLKECLNLKPA
jgi:uncharacterized coiled-coil protein SlyX